MRPSMVCEQHMRPYEPGRRNRLCSSDEQLLNAQTLSLPLRRTYLTTIYIYPNPAAFGALHAVDASESSRARRHGPHGTDSPLARGGIVVVPGIHIQSLNQSTTLAARSESRGRRSRPSTELNRLNRVNRCRRGPRMVFQPRHSTLCEHDGLVRFGYVDGSAQVAARQPAVGQKVQKVPVGVKRARTDGF